MYFSFFFLQKLESYEDNHETNELQEAVTDQEKDAPADNDLRGLKVKERSILQAKLTKLAIQIGYAGKSIKK